MSQSLAYTSLTFFALYCRPGNLYCFILVLCSHIYIYIYTYMVNVCGQIDCMTKNLSVCKQFSYRVVQFTVAGWVSIGFSSHNAIHNQKQCIFMSIAS